MAGSTGERQTIKYGCISIEALCRDMLDWETLYVSGRTQKPVRGSRAPWSSHPTLLLTTRMHATRQIGRAHV